MAAIMSTPGRWSHQSTSIMLGHYGPSGPRPLPTNPRSNYYLLICYVCQEVAKPNQEHTLHYGGIVCFSCRAFFRRAHQKTKCPAFVCKRGGTCEVTVANRRRCQKCRYDRCLAAGMIPDAVLTEDQKVIRFRKTILKRRKESGGSANNNDNIASPGDDQREEDDEEDENDFQTISPTLLPSVEFDQKFDFPENGSDFKTKIPRIEDLIESLSDDSCKIKIEENFLDVQNFGDCSELQFSNDFLIDSDDDKLPKDFNFSPKMANKCENKIDAISQAYQMAIMQMKSSSCSNQLFEKLTAVQSGDRSVNFGKKEILQYIVQLSEQFRHFALSHRQFGRLPQSDQLLLLARNAPLYTQLCLGTYLSSPSYKHQYCLLEIYNQLCCSDNSVDQDSPVPEKSYDGNYIDLKTFNAITRLFRSNADLDHYGQLIDQVKKLNPLTCSRFRAVLACAILFDCDESLNLSSFDEIQETSAHIELLLQSCSSSYTSLNDLKALFAKMAVFCAYNIAWDNTQICEENGTACNANPSFKLFSGFDLVMTYTQEEELWLDKQFKHMEEAFRSVTIGDEMINEFFMYSLGVPLSKKYMKNVVSLTLERMWRVFNIHQEFKELPGSIQRELMARNGPAGLAVMICRYENCPHGMQQIQEGFGELDELRWRENYLPTFQNFDKVRKMRMKDVVSELSVKLSQDQISEYVRIVEFFGPLVSDPVLHKLVIFLVLMKSTSPDKPSVLSGLQSTYTTIVRRRTSWMCKNEGKSGTRKNLETKKMIDKIEFCIENLEKLSEILLFILNKQ